MQLTSDSAIVCHRLSVPSITGVSVYLYKAALPNPPTCYAVLFIHLRSLRLICLFPLVWHNTLTGAHHAAWVIYVCNKKSAKLWWSIHPKTCKLSVCHIPAGTEILTPPALLLYIQFTPPSPPPPSTFLVLYCFFNTLFYCTTDRLHRSVILRSNFLFEVSSQFNWTK